MSKCIRFLALLSFLTFSNNCYSQFYKYNIDLNEIENDKLKVNLTLESPPENRMSFYFPRIIPGTYRLADYGKYISEFRAYDSEGNELKIRKKGKNQYILKEAYKTRKVTYTVEDTWDSGIKKDEVFKPAGTSFEKDKCYYLNTPGLFGYFLNYESKDFEIEFTGTEGLISSSALASKHYVDRHILKADNYSQLADSPILIAKSDTFSFKIKNCKIEVAAYHSGNKSLKTELKPIIIKSMRSITGFFDTLPCKDYKFLLYINDVEEEIRPIINNPDFKSILKFSSRHPSAGALEHMNSSSYYLLDMGDIHNASLLSKFNYESMLKSVIIHEFMHILSPLNIRTERIENFNFQDPVMSKHLWLYEGVTEYFAGIMQVKSGQLEPQLYFNDIIKEKIELGQKFPFKKMSMTEMSEKILKKKYNKRYEQVYYHGALLALCLDLEIIKLSNGKKDLRKVLLEMLDEYNVNNAVSEEKLIPEIISRVEPGLKSFFDNYVEGNDELLINHYFHYAGIRYFLYDQVFEPIPLISNKYGISGIENDVWKILINGKIKISETGPDSKFKIGDEIDYFQYQDQIKNADGSLKIAEGDSITLLAKNNGETREINLKVIFQNQTKTDVFRIEDNIPDEKLNIRSCWWKY